jgi:hypothetical protein
MKAIVKYYIKVILFMGLIFFSFAVISEFNSTHEYYRELFYYTFSILVLLMALSMATMQIIGLRKLGVRVFTDKVLRLRQEINIIANLQKQEFISKLKSEPIYKNIRINDISEGFKFKTKLTWLSYGEVVYVKIKCLNEFQNEYNIKSKPVWIFTIADYGKNYENILRIEKIIKNFA